MLAAIITVIVVLLAIGVALAGASVRVLREYERGVIFRLGRVIDKKGPGLIFLTPAVEHWRAGGHYPEPMRLAPADERELAVAGSPGECAVAIGIFLHHPIISAQKGAPVAARALEPVASNASLLRMVASLSPDEEAAAAFICAITWFS